MLVKEYRICMPITVEEYKIGQLYMIAKHSLEQSEAGEGVEVIKNEPYCDEVHGKGQYTEKRIHLSSKLPSWVRSLVPRIFYVTEKAWNYYPYTITEYTCSFVPLLSIRLDTKYENNKGTSENCLGIPAEELTTRAVDVVDIVNDVIPKQKYKECEDPSLFTSKHTNRGPFKSDWKETAEPIMCVYKLAKVKFEMWGLQVRVEEFTHKAVREILLLGHRQAVAWMDDWIGMSMEDVREYEKETQHSTNKKVLRQTESPMRTNVANDQASSSGGS